MKKAFYLILAGVGVGILFAPRKGSETRQKLMDDFSDWTDNAKDRIRDITRKGKDIAERTESRTNNLEVAASEKW